MLFLKCASKNNYNSLKVLTNKYSLNCDYFDIVYMRTVFTLYIKNVYFMMLSHLEIVDYLFINYVNSSLVIVCL